MDDLYFLSAAMHCGPGTLLVSNDKFHDHKFDIDPLVRIHFNRWQRLNKLTLKGFVDESPLFVVCSSTVLWATEIFEMKMIIIIKIYIVQIP